MKKKLKYRIFAGFLLLLALLLTAGIFSILEFMKLSNSVNAIIEDNYTTINAAKSMNEALEREDSAILLLLLGRTEEGREILNAADMKFMEALSIAENNITEKDEDKFINDLRNSYNEFKSIWNKPILNTDSEGNIKWYKENLYNIFLKTKESVNSLMTLNQNSMHDEANKLKEKSHRALMPGIVAIISTFIFALILNFFINFYFVGPITKLAQAIKNYSPSDGNFIADIRADNEIRNLELEIRDLIDRINLTKSTDSN